MRQMLFNDFRLKKGAQKHTPKDTPKSVDFRFLLTDSPAGLQGHVFNDSGANLEGKPNKKIVCPENLRHLFKEWRLSEFVTTLEQNRCSSGPGRKSL